MNASCLHSKEEPPMLPAVIVALPALSVAPIKLAEQVSELRKMATAVMPPVRVNAALVGARLAAFADEAKHSPSIAPSRSFDVRIILVPHWVDGLCNARVCQTNCVVQFTDSNAPLIAKALASCRRL
ncbi:MAG: hypothetical protein ACREVW_07865 [Burkholderiales bacterium]